MSRSLLNSPQFIFGFQLARNMVCSIAFVATANLTNNWCSSVHLNTNLFIELVSATAVAALLAFLFTKKISQLDDALDESDPIRFEGSALPTAQLIINQLMRAGRSDTIWKLEHTSIDQRQLTFTTPIKYSTCKFASKGISIQKMNNKLRMKVWLISDKNTTHARVSFSHEDNRNHFRAAKESALDEVEFIAINSSKRGALQPALQLLAR